MAIPRACILQGATKDVERPSQFVDTAVNSLCARSYASTAAPGTAFATPGVCTHSVAANAHEKTGRLSCAIICGFPPRFSLGLATPTASGTLIAEGNSGKDTLWET